jgi:hypothetical protein
VPKPSTEANEDEEGHLIDRSESESGTGATASEWLMDCDNGDVAVMGMMKGKGKGKEVIGQYTEANSETIAMVQIPRVKPALQRDPSGLDDEPPRGIAGATVPEPERCFKSGKGQDQRQGGQAVGTHPR